MTHPINATLCTEVETVQPDPAGRWHLAAHYTLHLDADHHDGPVAVICGKHGLLTTIPVDELHHIGSVMISAAHAGRKS